MTKTAFFCFFLVNILFSCTKKGRIFERERKGCTDDSTSLYSRVVVIQRFANVLNKTLATTSFKVTEKGTGKGFVIFDLVDTTNFEGRNDECVSFVDRHIYHFASIVFEESYSNIAYLENGQIKVFETINCKGKGNTLQDVIDYIEPKIEGSDNYDKILYRIRNYRKYGYYVAYDNYSVINCECDPCE